jgi:membrane protein implicated in regulation of membrane protease activity
MSYWIWVVLGIALLAFEMFIPVGFYLCILGLASLIVGCVTLVGLVTSFTVQAALFGVLGLFFWLFLAERLQTLLRSKEGRYDSVVGQVAKASEEIAPGARGVGELWGTVWKLENAGSSNIHVGDECVVVGSDGLTLQVTLKK